MEIPLNTAVAKDESLLRPYPMTVQLPWCSMLSTDPLATSNRSRREQTMAHATPSTIRYFGRLATWGGALEVIFE
jgi:hypothetical protein